MASAAVDVTTGSTPSFPDSQDGIDTHVGQHPQLKKVSVVDCDAVSEIVPNSKPFKIDNECFSGEVMLLMRTPDVDDKKQISPMGETPKRISQYMKGYKRRFEFQFQVRLKRVPTGPLFLGCEVEEMIKTSRFTKRLAGFLLAMIRRMNSGFHYSWGIDKTKTDPVALKDGRYENSHLSFPVEASMDRIVITKPGETPPKLGFELLETPESVKRRRKMGAGSVDWNLDDTYTMSLWSAYFDWIKWKSMNVPGCRPFSLCVVSAEQPVYLSVYELKDITPQCYKKKKPAHNRCDLQVYTRLEFANSNHTRGGLAPRFQGKYSRQDSVLAGETEGEGDSDEIGSESDFGDTDMKVACS